MPQTQWPTTSPKDSAISCRLVSDDELVWHGVPWKLAELLGSGRFASVYRLRKAASLPPDAQPQGGPEAVAAKVTRLPGLSPWARAQLAEEAIIWSSLSHPNVLRFYGTVANSTLHISLLEFARGGELFDRIVKMEDFSEANAADQVCAAGARCGTAVGSEGSRPRTQPGSDGVRTRECWPRPEP